MSDENEKPVEGVTAKRADELRAKAKATVEKERLAKAEAALLKKYEDEERRSSGIVEPLEQVNLDLPAFCDRITIDGVIFFHGRNYTVPRSQAQVMREIQQNTWEHQAQVDGKPDSFYRRSRGEHLGANGASNILRA